MALFYVRTSSSNSSPPSSTRKRNGHSDSIRSKGGVRVHYGAYLCSHTICRGWGIGTGSPREVAGRLRGDSTHDPGYVLPRTLLLLGTSVNRRSTGMRRVSPAGIMIEVDRVENPPVFCRREKGGGHMPTYVVLVNWTDQGIRNVKQTIERTDSGGELAEKHGLKLKQAYWTVGAYDMVCISRHRTTRP